jgi:multidrug efflux pump
MLSSKVLSKGMGERGLAGWITRRFDALRRSYMKALSATLRVSPVVLIFGFVVSLLIFPFWMFSKQEAAPTEDQGVIFGIVFSAPEATLDQTMLFARQVNDIFKSFPETAQTFQVTSIIGPLRAVRKFDFHCYRCKRRNHREACQSCQRAVC